MQRLRLAAFPLVFILFLFACDDDGTAPPAGGGVRVEIAAADSVLAVGGTLALEAALLDAHGDPVDGAAIGWTTTDAAAASVTTGGVVTGHAIGYVDVIASSDAFADTLRVRVFDDDVPLYRMRVRYGRGAAALTHDLTAGMRFSDVMGDGPGDEAGMAGYQLGSGRDTSLVIILPGSEHGGRRAIAPFPLDGSPVVAPVALLRFGRSETGDLEYFASVGAGHIDLAIEPAPAPGWRVGSVRGFVQLPLVRLAPGPSGPVLTADTLWLHANVNLTYQHTLRGWSEVALLDGPLVGESVLATAYGDDDNHGGWMMGWDADFDGLGSGPGRWEMSQELRMLTAAVGTFALPRFTGEAFGEPALWPERFSSIFYRDDPRFALVVDGAVTITRWLPATLEDYGRIEGTIDARFELWTPDLSAPTGDTIRAVTRFALPFSPEAGLPAVPPVRPALSF